jgi:hypothetical protein
MAGLHEIPSNQLQPLTTEEKDRMGNSNLTAKLKEYKQSRLPLPPNPLIASIIVKNEAGIIIPTTLANQLELESTLSRWAIVGHREAPSVLLVGKNLEKDDWININEAHTTIEIENRSIILGPYSRRYTPFYLRIAGVDKEQNRIIAATYDLAEKNRLIKTNISIPYAEIDNKFHELTNPMPKDGNSSYFTAGLITSAMSWSVWTSKEKPSTRHERFLGLEFDENFNIRLERPDTQNYYSEEDYSLFDKMGYFTRRKGGIFTVGLTKEGAGRRKVDPWEISVPEFLQKA